MDQVVLEKRNLNFLSECGHQYVVTKMTSNIMRHSIFDATSPMRDLLRDSCIHDFDKQLNGSNYKRYIKTHILTFARDVITETFLYKSSTRGDSRMWFGSVAKKMIRIDDLIMAMTLNREIYVIDISLIDIDNCIRSSIKNPIKAFFTAKDKEILESGTS